MGKTRNDGWTLARWKFTWWGQWGSFSGNNIYIGNDTKNTVNPSGNIGIGKDALKNLSEDEANVVLLNTVVGSYSGTLIDTGMYNCIMGAHSWKKDQ